LEIRVILEILKNDRVQVRIDMVQEEIALEKSSTFLFPK